MKFFLFFFFNIISFVAFAQTEPKFNPLVDMYKYKTIGEVFTRLRKLKYFNGVLLMKTNGDSSIEGTYQGQNIIVSKNKQGISIPDSSFFTTLTFKNKKDFKSFLAAGRIFFTQTGYDRNQFCEMEIFRKMDIKNVLLNIVFKKCEMDTKQCIYMLSFEPYSMFRCGNEL